MKNNLFPEPELRLIFNIRYTTQVIAESSSVIAPTTNSMMGQSGFY